MSWARAAVGLTVVVAAAGLPLSGGSGADPRTPDGLPGTAPPFLGIAVLGDGELTAAVDAYGNVVDLRPNPAGRALIENSAERQAAGTVPGDTGIQVRVRPGGGRTLPMWRADEIRQRYLPGTNVLRTAARFGQKRVEIEAAVDKGRLTIVASGDAKPEVRVNAGIACRQEAGQVVSVVCSNGPLDDDASARAHAVIAEATRGDRRWLARARPLGAAAPTWAREMYERSLLVLRSLTDRRAGAVAAGARDGWAYVWPRDAAAVSIAFAEAGYLSEAERVTRFLLGLGLEDAARFHGDGSPVPGRGAQGDAIGWIAAASKAAGTVDSAARTARILAGDQHVPWRDRPDYREQGPGDYLGNALASTPADVSEFSRHIWGESSDTPSREGLMREAGEPESGLDAAASWGVRPFPHLALYPQIRRTLNALAGAGGRFGITPGESWDGGSDPWSAPTAWSAWSLAALGERRQALQLLGALRRSATPVGTLPERVDAETGVPRSTTPLAWSHAFAILALRELWP